MNKGEIVEKVKMYADEAHGDQMRRYVSERYIVHPIRVMEIVRDYSQELSLLAASLLHDVLEDTEVTDGELKSFLDSVMDREESDKTFELVKELTDEFIKAKYPALNRRTRRTREAERLAEASSDAHTVKYADIIDNVNDISQHDKDFALTYIRESKQLLCHMDKGNPDLYARAMSVVNEAMQQHFHKANIKAL
jgi:(p)ppGpp synthase/HD superfamily hydrolase